MSEKFQETVTVVSQKQIGTGIYDLTIQTKEIAAAAKAGQFVWYTVTMQASFYLVQSVCAELTAKQVHCAWFTA